jgi:hypothetical protein
MASAACRLPEMACMALHSTAHQVRHTQRGWLASQLALLPAHTWFCLSQFSMHTCAAASVLGGCAVTLARAKDSSRLACRRHQQPAASLATGRPPQHLPQGTQQQQAQAVMLRHRHTASRMPCCILVNQHALPSANSCMSLLAAATACACCPTHWRQPRASAAPPGLHIVWQLRMPPSLRVVPQRAQPRAGCASQPWSRPWLLLMWTWTPPAASPCPAGSVSVDSPGKECMHGQLTVGSLWPVVVSRSAAAHDACVSHAQVHATAVCGSPSLSHLVCTLPAFTQCCLDGYLP